MTLCLVLAMALAAAAYFIPAQSDDSSAAGIGDYEILGTTETYDDLKSVFDFINGDGGIDYTIIVKSNDEDVTSFVLNAGISVILTSSDGKQFILKMSAGRHGTVNGSLTLENIILDGNNKAGGIVVNAGGFLTMQDGAVIQNCSTGYGSNGGGVYNYGTFTMEGGEISGNTAGFGGGVYNDTNSTFNMSGGEISGNTANYDGGGVYNDYGSTFNMSGGEISGNTAGYGGGVYNEGSTFTMKGGEVSGNTAYCGGGVYNNANSTFNMSDGEISGNFATDNYGGGGGVHNYDSTFNMSGGEISGNTADYGYGGGVYNYDSTFTMKGGKISGNTAGLGGGVCNYSGSTFTMEGGEISGNTVHRDGGGVYNRFGTFTMESGEISYNTADDGGGVYNNGGTLTMEGGEISYNTAHRDGGGVYNYGTFTMEGGVISSNTSDYDGGGVYNYDTFTMEGGVISSNTTNYDGGGVYNYDKFTMEGGVISSNKANYGGGVYNNSTFTMEGGEISSNTSGYDGGGVYNYGSTFTMEGGEISGNTSDYNGGGVCNQSGAFTMEDGEIKYNTAYIGGGIFNDDALISIIGGEISGNTAKGTDAFGSGGGIYTTNLAYLTVNGTVFSGNFAPTLRVMDIANDADINGNGISDLENYENNIVNVVLLGATVDINLNAPAYNNYDINYPGDSYLVHVDIEPDGAGTVTVTDSTGTVYDPLTSDGWIRVPSTAISITLSAAPESESKYEFIQFIVNGVPESSSYLADVPISEGMYVVAEFKSLLVEEDHLIIAAADDGSVINPAGEVSVPYGEDITFIFSAKPGHKMIAVYVDGVAISAAALASGEYTFSNVLDDHTIEVVSSSIGGGNGGDGGDSGNGGDGGDSNVNTEGNGKGDGKWAVLNLICAVIAILTGIIAVIAGRDRFRKDDEEKRSKTALILRVLTLVIGVTTVIIYFLTEDWNLPVTPTDGWTLIMFILLLATLVLTFVSFRFDETPADDEEDR